MTSERLGFVGLGLTGLPMTRRLLAAGRAVAVWNRSPEKTASAQAAGAEPQASPAAVARAADIVFLCLTDAAAVEEVVFGAAGLAEAPGANKIVVDCSSIPPGATRDFAARLADVNGMRWLDAPCRAAPGAPRRARSPSWRAGLRRTSRGSNRMSACWRSASR